MAIERCELCGFDGEAWTDEGAVGTAERLPVRWRQAIEAVSDHDLQRRPVDHMWSIAEYTDHVRETAFGMRFVLDVVLESPGTDLGNPPASRFEPEPRRIDVDRALAGFGSETKLLCERLRATPPDRWDRSCVISGEAVDVHWIARHIVHDVEHHLGDVDRLRAALGRPLDRELGAHRSTGRERR
jgi:DinB superfamily